MRQLAALVVMSGTAIASPNLDVRVDADGLGFARQAVPAPASVSEAGAASLTKSRTIYINRMGGMLSPGVNDSRSQVSSLVSKPTQLQGWVVDDATWGEVMQCMTQIWARFDVAITDVDPGQTSHIEVMCGDLPTTIGLPGNYGGVAPMRVDCGVVDNAIVFAFPAKLGNNARRVCEVMSQEVGHAYGLDHELEAADPMTYLAYAGERTFQDHSASCGESKARSCGIGGSVCSADQNTVQMLLERLGAAGADNTAPTLRVTTPSDGAKVDAGFVVVAQASDNIAVSEVALVVDGVQVSTRVSAPYSFTTDSTLAPGDHTITLEAIDTNNNKTVTEVSVQIADSTPAFDGMNCSTGSPNLGIGVGVVLLGLCRRRRATRA